MSKRHTVREKFMKYKDVVIDTHADGSVHISVSEQKLDLTEEQALGLNDLLADALSWDDDE